MDRFKQIDIHEAHEMINANKATIVDIRDEESYRGAHINGAIWVSDENMAGFLSGVDRNKPLICYCYHGFSSQAVAGFLKDQGFADVYSLIGGFKSS